MELFNETIICYGKIKSNNLIVDNLRCTLNLNRVDTRLITAEIIEPEPKTGKINSIIQGNKEIIFEADKFGRQVLIKSRNNSYQIKFSEEAKITLLPYFVSVNDIYEIDKIKKVSFTSSITPSKTIFERQMITNHFSKGLLGNWNVSKKSPSDKEWLENEILIKTSFGEFKLFPGFVFKEEKGKNYLQSYNILRQLFITLKLENDDVNLSDKFRKYEEEINIFLKSLSFLFAKRFEVYFTNIFCQGVDGKALSESSVYYRIKTEPIIEDNRFVYGDNYTKLFSTMRDTIKSYKALNNTEKVLFDKIMERYLIAFTYRKVDTAVIYSLSCLDIIKNSLRGNKRRNGFIKDLIEVCEIKNIEWIDLFPYLLKEDIYDKKIKKDMELNKIRNDIIHFGKYPSNYISVQEEILSTRALCERFLLKHLSMEYPNSILGRKTKY